jgi:hypothetical protein
MEFKAFEAAREFYNRYARHAGFGTRIGHTNDANRYVYCNRQGTYQSKVEETDRQRDKTTNRCGCTAGIRIKEKGPYFFVIETIRFEHNHHMIQSPSMMNFLHSHKDFDPSLLEFVKFLQFENVPHRTIMSILYSSVGGAPRWPRCRRLRLRRGASMKGGSTSSPGTKRSYEPPDAIATNKQGVTGDREEQ